MIAVMDELAHVPLSLRDTGTLCNLILKDIQAAGIDPSRPIEPQVPEQDPGSLLDRETIVAIVHLQLDLWARLSQANSRLMRSSI